MRNLLKYICIFFIVGMVLGCEEDPDMVDEIKPIPVIYAIFDKYEPMHYIYITKTFSSDPYGADYNAKIRDSIYFDNVWIQIVLIKKIEVHDGPDEAEADTIFPILTIRHDKNPGSFSYPDFEVYSFEQELDTFDYIQMNINTLLDTISLVKKGIPKVEGNNFSATSILYENITSLLLTTLPISSDIQYRQFDKVEIEIWTSPSFFSSTSNPEISQINNDLIGTIYEPRPSYLGRITSKSSRIRKDLELDYFTKKELWQDANLKKLKFVEW